MDFAQEVLKLGPAGLVCLVLWIGISKSEKRESLKDTRIQLLESQLTESYDERVEAADRIATAIHGTKSALDALTQEIRSKR